MTKIFQKSLFLFMLCISALLRAGCPGGDSSQEGTSPDGVNLLVCYPATASVGQQITITVILTNATLGPVLEATGEAFLPDYAGAFTVNSLTLTAGPTPTTLNSTAAAQNNGIGEFEYGSLAATTSGTATAILTANTAGVYTYTPVVADRTGSTTFATPVTITVSGSVCPPVTAANGVGTNACTQSSTTGNLNSFVIGGTAPYIFTTSGAVNGTVSVNGSVYTFTPNITGAGTGSFTYHAVDSAGCPSNTGTITVPIVQSPTANNGTFTTCMNEAILGGTLTATGGTTTYTFAIVTNGHLGTAAITNATTGIFNYVPSPNTVGNDSFTFQVTDSNGCVSNIATVTIDIDSPIASSTGSNECANVPVSANLNSLVTGGTGLYSFEQLGAAVGGTVAISSTGAYTFTPNAGYTGPAGFSYSVTDGLGCSATGAVDFVFSSIDISPSGIDLCTNATATGNLSDLVSSGLPPYTFGPTGSAVGGTVTVGSNGNFVFTPTSGFTGQASFDYQVTDTAGCLATGGVDITYIAGPTANDAAYTICIHENIIGGTLTANGGLPPYTFTLVTNGSLGFAEITNPTTGTFSYFSDEGTFGLDSFTFQVTDSNGCVSNIATVTIDIDSPIASSTGSNECANVPVSANLNSLVTGGAAPYTFAQLGAAVGGTVTVGSDGAYTFTPTPGYTGPAAFSYTVTDDLGCSATGLLYFVFSSIDVSPSGIDLCTNTTATGNLSDLVSSGLPPYTFGPTGSAVGGTVTVDADGSFMFTPTTGFAGQASFEYQVTDSAGCLATGIVDITYAAPIASAGLASICENSSLIGATLSATGGTPPYAFAIVTPATLGTVTITDVTTGTFNYVPFPDTFGIDSFTFQVTDANGCVSNTAAYQITINQSPITSNGLLDDCVNTTISGSLDGLVSGGTPPYTFTPNGTQVGGIATVSSTGIYSFVPTTNFSGSGHFGYQVTDTNGCLSTGMVDVNIASPTAGATSVDTCFNTPISGNLAALATGGFPPYVFSLTGLPVGGAATVSGTGIYSFVPSTGFSGPGGFEYQVTDSNACIATADVSVTVDSLAAGNGTILSCMPSFTSNLDHYVNGGTGALTFTGPLSISCGDVTIDPDGSFTYDSAGNSGPCSFEYQVTDAQGCVSTGTITVTIDNPTTTPLAVDDCVNSPVSGDLTSQFTGVPPFVFSLTGMTDNGVASVESDGTYIFTPTAGFSGPAGFEYAVTDANGCSATGAVDITVASPIISPTAINSCSYESVFGDLSSLVTSGFPPYVFSLTGLPVGGEVTVDDVGNYVFTPNIGFSGPGGFEYEVTDSNGCESVGNVAINVDSLSTNYDGMVQTCNQTLTGTLADFVNGGSGPLTFVGFGISCGDITVNPDGSYIYTAPTGFTGPCTMEYEVTDSLGCYSSGSLTIVANLASQVLDSAISSCADRSVDGTLANLIVGDQQPPFTFAIVTQPVHGTITNFNSATGTYTYVPSPGYIGTDSFQFQVTDGNGCVSNVGTITVSVVSCCPLSSNPLMQLILEMYWGFSGVTGL